MDTLKWSYIAAIIIVMIVIVYCVQYVDTTEQLAYGSPANADVSPAVATRVPGINVMDPPVTIGDTQDANFYVKLYEGFEYNDLQAEFVDATREIIKLNLKSYEINLPIVGGGLDAVRKVELWAVDDGVNDNVASGVSGMYNTYLEPSYALRANPARYHHIVTVRPSNAPVRANVEFPIKKLFVIAIL
jgi:hypothetical protein